MLHGQAEADGIRSQHLSARGRCRVAHIVTAVMAGEGRRVRKLAARAACAQSRWGTDAVCFRSQTLIPSGWEDGLPGLTFFVSQAFPD